MNTDSQIYQIYRTLNAYLQKEIGRFYFWTLFVRKENRPSFKRWKYLRDGMKLLTSSKALVPFMERTLVETLIKNSTIFVIFLSVYQ